MSIGIAIGSDSPAIKKQLKHAIDDNAISIITENGNELSVEQLFDLLKENYKKA